MLARVSGSYEGKRGLVLGVANKRSIAWAIAKRLADAGAELAFTYQGERIEKSVRELAESVASPLVTECDVRSDDDVARVFREVGEVFDGGLDLLVHSVAFAAAEDLEGRFTDTPRDRFWMALDVSAYSLVACARAAEPLMEARGGGSIVTMTYLGGERAVPHYNVMGVAKATLDASVRYLAWDLGQKNIRVNAISAGPVRTLCRTLDRGLPDDGGDRRGALAAPSAHRRGRRRRGRRLSSFGRCEERDGDDAVRGLRLPRYGDVSRHRSSFSPTFRFSPSTFTSLSTSTVTRCQPSEREREPGAAVDRDTWSRARTERTRAEARRSRRSRTARASRSCSGPAPVSANQPWQKIGTGAGGLDALRRDADAAALEEPDGPGRALNPPAVREQSLRREPARARHCGVADVEPAVQRDRADAEALQLAGHVAAPVAAVEPLEPVRDRLRGLRRSRRVAARPLAQRRGVVPEIDAAVMDAGIEDGKLEQAACGGRHRSGGIARRGLAVDVRVQVDEEQARRRAPRRPCA